MGETARLRLWTLKNIPLLFFLRPSVVETSAERCVIRLPLSRRSRNHLGSMYFGALCAGADLAGALTAMRCIAVSGRRISLIFKDVCAQFHKRAEGDVHFSCEDGQAVGNLVASAIASGEREELPVRIVATVPDKLGDEPVAEFLLTLSIKRRDWRRLSLLPLSRRCRHPERVSARDPFRVIMRLRKGSLGPPAFGMTREGRRR